MFASGDGSRTIELYNSSGIVLQSGTYFIPNGPSRVNLNFNVPPGTALRLGATGTPNLWRNNTGVVYPYTVTDTLSITGSSAGATYYYFFYDWEIEVGGGVCNSLPALANVIVTPCTGIDPAADLTANLSVYPNPSTGIFNVNLILPGAGSDVEFSIFDLTGRNLFRQIERNISGEYIKVMDLSGFAKGIYELSVVIEGRKYIRRIDIH
ncbi:MAG: T9SS type A sorting domain-containing protein [Bacteroidetes bacterium]|nr:T9SS type A sorting domain-containing protein [Bacteroidota bacterium]